MIAFDSGPKLSLHDAGQAGATLERPVPDAGDAIADRDTRQAGATLERIVPDAGEGQWGRTHIFDNLTRLDTRYHSPTNRTPNWHAMPARTLLDRPNINS